MKNVAIIASTLNGGGLNRILSHMQPILLDRRNYKNAECSLSVSEKRQGMPRPVPMA